MTHDAKPYTADDCCAIERGDMFLTLDRVTDTVKALAAKQAELDGVRDTLRRVSGENTTLRGANYDLIMAHKRDLAAALREVERETLERAKREQEPQKPPVGVAWMREQLKRIFFRWAGADSGSPEMHNRDVEIDGLLLDHWTAPVFRVQASQQPQQDDVSAAREAFDNAVAVSILRVACQHIDGLDISKQSSCPEDMAMWAVTYIDRLVAEAEARCQCADMQGGKLCRACLEDEEATDV